LRVGVTRSASGTDQQAGQREADTAVVTELVNHWHISGSHVLVARVFVPAGAPKPQVQLGRNGMTPADSEVPSLFSSPSTWATF
jgi:hypothetical protein